MISKNTVIIMTSNAGARSIAAPKRLGFTSVETPEQSYEMMKKGVMDEIKTIFKPEFLNRIDDIIVFHPLEQEEITRIVRLLTDVMAKRVKENMNITVSFTKKASKKLPRRAMIRRMAQDRCAEPSSLRLRMPSRRNIFWAISKRGIRFPSG